MGQGEPQRLKVGKSGLGEARLTAAIWRKIPHDIAMIS